MMLMNRFRPLANGLQKASPAGRRGITTSTIIGGHKDVNPEGPKTFPVYNPASGELLAHVADMGAEETRELIATAKKTLPSWSRRTAHERSAITRRIAESLHENADDLARIITLEMGKPLAEARGEVVYSAAFFEWFSEECKRTYGQVIPTHTNDKRLMTIRQPVGVCALITPWNFPLAMLARKAAAAISVGCTTVCKPAEDTPLTAIALSQLVEDAGLPHGVLNLVTGSRESAPIIGAELATNPDVKKLSFTGSTGVGKLLAEQCATTMKKVSMELGGNASFIIFDDANLDEAINHLLASKFRNSGQTCVCTNRVYVQSSVYDKVASMLSAKVADMKVGNGLLDGVVQGPLINEAARSKVEAHVEDALEKGAEVVTGGRQSDLGANFFEPTVLKGMDSSMKIYSEETFGPVAGLFKFETEDEVVALANDTPYGLASYFFTQDPSRIWRMSESIDCGMVGANDGLMSCAHAPFGGVKESGLGREGGACGVDDYLETKYVSMGGISH